MELTDSLDLPVDRNRVWQALNDPAVLKACIAGCETFDSTGENAYRCIVTASVGPVKARFTSKVTLADVDAPNAYTLHFDGQGGAAGFGKGSARVTLSDAATHGGTKLTYTASAQVGGKLAQVGSRLIDAAAKKVAADFFAKFAVHLGAGADSAAEHKTSTAHASAADNTHFPLWLKLVGVIGGVVVLTQFIRH